MGRILYPLLATILFFNQISYALPVEVVSSTLALPVGVSLSKEGALEFYFTGSPSKQERNRLIQMALDSFNTPEKELWVNLHPEAKDGQILSYDLWNTELGRVMLQTDVELKERAKEIISKDPELSDMAEEMFGEGDVTFRCWIEPEQVRVVRGKDGAVIEEARMKVRVEVKGVDSEVKKEFEERLGEILTKEVNEGAEFAGNRQAFNAFLLGKSLRELAKEMGRKELLGVRFSTGMDETFWKREYLLRYLSSYRDSETVAGGVVYKVPQRFGPPRNSGAIDVTWFVRAGDKIRGLLSRLGVLGRELTRAQAQLVTQKYENEARLRIVALMLWENVTGNEGYLRKKYGKLYESYKDLEIDEILKSLPHAKWMIEHALPWIRGCKGEPEDFVRLMERLYSISVMMENLSSLPRESVLPEYVFFKAFLEHENWEKLIEGMTAYEVNYLLLTLGRILLWERVDRRKRSKGESLPSLRGLDVAKLYGLLLSAKRQVDRWMMENAEERPKGRFVYLDYIVLYIGEVVRGLLTPSGESVLIEALGYPWWLEYFTAINDSGLERKDFGKQRRLLAILQGKGLKGPLGKKTLFRLAGLVRKGILPPSLLKKGINRAGERVDVLFWALADFKEILEEFYMKRRGNRPEVETFVKDIVSVFVDVAVAIRDKESAYRIISGMRRILTRKVKGDSEFLERLSLPWLKEVIDRYHEDAGLFFELLIEQVEDRRTRKILDILGPEKYLSLFGGSAPVMEDKSTLLRSLAQSLDSSTYDEDVKRFFSKPEVIANILLRMNDGERGFETLVHWLDKRGLLESSLSDFLGDKEVRREFYKGLGRGKAFAFLIKFVLFGALPEEEKKRRIEEWRDDYLRGFLLRLANDKSQEEYNRILDAFVHAVKKERAGIKEMPVKALKVYVDVWAKNTWLPIEKIVWVVETLEEIFSWKGTRAEMIKRMLVKATQSYDLKPIEFFYEHPEFAAFLKDVARGVITSPEGDALALMIEKGDLKRIQRLFSMDFQEDYRHSMERASQEEIGFRYTEMDGALANAGEELWKAIRQFPPEKGLSVTREEMVRLFSVLDYNRLTQEERRNLLNRIRNLTLFLRRDDALYRKVSGGDNTGEALARDVVDRLYALFESMSRREKRALVNALVWSGLGGQITRGTKDRYILTKYAVTAFNWIEHDIAFSLWGNLLGDISFPSSLEKAVESLICRQDLFFNLGSAYNFQDFVSAPRQPLLLFTFLIRLSEDDGKAFSLEEIRAMLDMMEGKVDGNDPFENEKDFLEWRLARAFAPPDKLFIEEKPFISKAKKLLFKLDEHLWSSLVRVFDGGAIYELARKSPEAYKRLILEVDKRVNGFLKEKQVELIGVDVVMDLDLERLPFAIRDAILTEMVDSIAKGRIELGLGYDNDKQMLTVVVEVFRMSLTAKEVVSKAVSRGTIFTLFSPYAILSTPRAVGQVVKEVLAEEALSEGMYHALIRTIENSFLWRKDMLGGFRPYRPDEVRYWEYFLDSRRLERKVLMKMLEKGKIEEKVVEEVMQAVKGKTGWDLIKHAAEVIVERGLDYSEEASQVLEAYTVGVLNGKIALPKPKKIELDGGGKAGGKGGIVYTFPRPVEVLVFE